MDAPDVERPRRLVPAHLVMHGVVFVEDLKIDGRPVGCLDARDRRAARPERHRTIEGVGVHRAPRLRAVDRQIDERLDDARALDRVGVHDDRADDARRRRGHGVGNRVHRAVADRGGHLSRAREARHVLLVHGVDAAAADAVVRMVLQERFPRVAKLAGRVPETGRDDRCEHGERLGVRLEERLHVGVLLLEIDARRQDAGQKVRVVGAAAQFADDRFERRPQRLDGGADGGDVRGQRGVLRALIGFGREALDERGNCGLRLDVIDAVHEQRLARARARPLVGDLLSRARRRRRRIEHDSRRVAVTLRRQVHHQDARTVGRLPPVLGVAAAEAAPQNRVVEADLPPDLRHLADVAEEIRHVADRHRRTKRARHAMAAQQIAHQRFAADEKLVRHHVPRPDQDAARRDRRAKARFLLWPDLEVVLEHDRLAVEVEVFVSRLVVEQIEQAIDERDQAKPELFAREIPLAIPMRVRDDVDVEHAACLSSG